MNRWMKCTCLLIFGLLLPGIRAEASAQDVILKTEENKVEVTMGALPEDALSMQLALDVKVTEGNADVSFEFAPGITGNVKQYRYDRDTGIMSIYISGNRDQKLSGDQEFGIGTIVVDAGTGSASATVDVRQGSLQIVNDAYGLYRFGEINVSPVQKVTVGEQDTGGSGPSDSGEPSDSQSPVIPQEPSDAQEPSASGEISGSDDSSGSGEKLSDTTEPVSSAGQPAAVAERVKPRRDIRIRTGNSRRVSGTVPGPEKEEMPKEEFQEENMDTDRIPALESEEHGRTESAGEQDFSDMGKTDDRILMAALLAAGIAAAVIVFLMLQEYDRKRKARKRRSRKRRIRKKETHSRKKKKPGKNQP